MYIQPAVNNNISMQAKPGNIGNLNSFKNRVKQKIIDVLPSIEFKNPTELIKKIDERISRPAENRAIMGFTAILLQPMIDWCNMKVDDETRRVSICRTIAKIIIGTTVGIFVRGSVYKLIKNMTNLNGTTRSSRLFLPEKYINDMLNNPKFLENYRSALSTSTAIGVMLFTNFAIDAPLTAKLTNYFIKKSENKSLKEVSYEKSS